MKEIKKVLFVVNPISGDVDKNELLEFIENELKQQDIALEIYKTNGENDISNIKSIVEQSQFDRVFVAGGDGTIKMVSEALLSTNVPMVLFPAGSANGFALNFDIPENKEAQLDVALFGNIIEVDLIKINEHYSLHLADFGVNADLIKNYDNATLRGKAGYLLQTIPTLMKSNHPYEFEISSNGERFVLEASVLSIANCQKYGTGACINPEGKSNDGKFEIIGFKNLNLIEIVKTFTNQTTLNPEFATSTSTTSAKVNCKSPVPFQIDGEYIGELENIEVSILHKAIQLCIASN
ncbi:diacylglycerol/lipid kinase family protein [Brumimicrobium aurantiacum]|nr:diacylglycerol kinase family protein [Brumimicrobium aurantiacum]